MDAGAKHSALLRAAARLVHRGTHRTLCDALSALLPYDDHGGRTWWAVKNVYLGYFLPAEFEMPWGWWRSRSAGVLGALLAADMAESEGM